MNMYITRNDVLAIEHMACFKKDITTPKLLFRNHNNVIHTILIAKDFNIKIKFISGTNPLEITDYFLESRDPLLDFSSILREILYAVREENK